MMSTNYNGWKLLDKVLLVYRDNGKNLIQAYLCDPNNKNQINSAKRWACYNEPETANMLLADNNNFTFELLSSAGGSSQGGKLSFWNCKVTKDNQTFSIGINADLLLDLLKQSTFKNGVCEQPVCFATNRGSVGVLHSDMTEYKDALADMKTKKNINTGKTTKWKIGHTYNTLTESNVYLYKFYQWYEYKEDYGTTNYRYRNDIKKQLHRLHTPKVIYFTPRYDSTKTKMSDYLDGIVHDWNYREKLPSRKLGDAVVEIDVSEEEIKQSIHNSILKFINNRSCFYANNLFGLSTNNVEPYSFTKKELDYFDKTNIKIVY